MSLFSCFSWRCSATGPHLWRIILPCTISGPNYFKPHQLITYMFLHGGFAHIFWNMLILWMFGSILENFWGPKRFLTFYIVCGIGAAVLHLLVLYHELTPVWQELNNYPIHEQGGFRLDPNSPLNTATLGASGAIFGCMVAFGLLFPNSLIYIYALIPVKAKWAVLAYVLFELFSGIQNTAGDNVAHWAHLGGGLVGLLPGFLLAKNRSPQFLLNQGFCPLVNTYTLNRTDA